MAVRTVRATRLPSDDIRAFRRAVRFLRQSRRLHKTTGELTWRDAEAALVERSNDLVDHLLRAGLEAQS